MSEKLNIISYLSQPDHIKSVDFPDTKAELIKLYLKFQDIDTARELAESIANIQNKQQVLAQIAIKYASNNQIDKALEIAQNNTQAPKILAEIVNTKIKLNQLDQALEFAESITGEVIRSEILVNIAKIYTDTDKFGHLLKVVKSIKDLSEQSKTLIKIVSQTKRTEILTDAIEIAKKIENGQNKSIILSSIAGAYIDNNQLNQALEIVKDPSLENEPNIQNKQQVLAQIAIKYASNNQIDKALEIAQNNTQAPKILAEIVNTKIKLNQLDQALEIVKGLPFKSTHLNAIATKSKSMEMLDKLLEITNSITEDSYGIHSILKTISLECLKYNQNDRALEIALKIDDINKKMEVLEMILDKSINIEFSQKVSKSIKDLRNEEIKARDLAKIEIQSYESHNIPLDLLYLANDYRYVTKRSSELVEIASQTNNIKSLKEALELINTVDDEDTKSDMIAELAGKLSNLAFIPIILNSVRGLSSDYFKAKALSAIASQTNDLNILAEAFNIANNINVEGYKFKCLNFIAKTYSRIFLHQKQKDSKILVLQWFAKYIEPMLVQLTLMQSDILELKLSFINTFLEDIPIQHFSNQTSRDNDFGKVNPENVLQASVIDSRIALKEISQNNLYLISANPLMEKIQKVLNLPNDFSNLDAFRSDVTTKIIYGDIRDSARLLNTLIKKDVKNSFRYLQKFIFSLKDRGLPQKNIKNYFNLFVKIATKYSLLNSSWSKIIPQKSEILLRLIDIRNKNTNWDMMNLDSLVKTLDELSLLDEDIEDLSLIELALNNNIISPTLYKIIKITPKENITKILTLIQKEQSKIFTNELPSIKEIVQYLDSVSVEEKKDIEDVSSKDLLLEMIVSVFKIKNYSTSQKLLDKLIQHQTEIDTHLIKYLKKDQANSEILMANEMQVFKEGEDYDSNLLEKLNKWIVFKNVDNKENVAQNLPLNIIQSRVIELSDFKKNGDFKIGFLPKILDFLSANPNLASKINEIKDNLSQIYKIKTEVDKLKNGKVELDGEEKIEELNHKSQNIYFQALNQIQELSGELLKDNIKDVFDRNAIAISEEDKELVSKKINNLFNNCFTINSEKLKFITYLDENSEKRKLEVFVSKSPASFFAKAGADLCTSNDFDTWLNLKNYFHINFIENGKLAANIQAYIENINGKDTLVLRGLNPTVNFLNTVSADLFVKTVFDFSKKLSQKWLGKDNIYISETLGKWDAATNRPQVLSILNSKVYKSKKPIDHTMQITNEIAVNKIYPI